MKDILKPSKRKCECDLCKRNRKFARIISKLPPRDRKWMDDFYNYAFENEAELEMIEASKDL